jgi:hypothetical protein
MNQEDNNRQLSFLWVYLEDAACCGEVGVYGHVHEQIEGVQSGPAVVFGHHLQQRLQRSLGGRRRRQQNKPVHQHLEQHLQNKPKQTK